MLPLNIPKEKGFFFNLCLVEAAEVKSGSAEHTILRIPDQVATFLKVGNHSYRTRLLKVTVESGGL